jgi:hypothetical protein
MPVLPKLVGKLLSMPELCQCVVNLRGDEKLRPSKSLPKRLRSRPRDKVSWNRMWAKRMPWSSSIKMRQVAKAITKAESDFGKEQ